MYTKNVMFPSSLLCNSLLKEKQKKSTRVCSLTLFAMLFLENEEKTSGKKIQRHNKYISDTSLDKRHNIT